MACLVSFQLVWFSRSCCLYVSVLFQMLLDEITIIKIAPILIHCFLILSAFLFYLFFYFLGRGVWSYFTVV